MSADSQGCRRIKGGYGDLDEGFGIRLRVLEVFVLLESGKNNSRNTSLLNERFSRCFEQYEKATEDYIYILDIIVDFGHRFLLQVCL